MICKKTDYSASDWDRIISQLKIPHILQTWEWGMVKSQYGWSSEQLIWYDHNHIAAAALVLKRSVEIPLLRGLTNILYIPKGPVLDWNDIDLSRQVLMDMNDYAKNNGAIFIKIDPDVSLGTGMPNGTEHQTHLEGQAFRSFLEANGWMFSKEQVQFRNTVLIDLTRSEEELLSNMKQKTRYNIRLASRKGVKIRIGTMDDLEILYQMYAETSLRDGFTIRNQEYYKSVWGTFIQTSSERNIDSKQPDYIPIAEPLIAEVDQEPIAAVIVFRFGGIAWYLYGMSRAVYREKMPNYLLQWEAIRKAKAAGCHTYDLWGAPDHFDENDPLWGVYRFKEGLGGKVVRHLGAWDLPVRPAFYHLYSNILPTILDFMRIRGRKTTERSILE